MTATTINEFINARDLLWAWTGRILRARYQQSVLGGLWILIQPIATVTIFTVIFTLVIPIDTSPIPYVVFNYAALAPWLLFASTLTDMANSLIENMQLITKVYFPREVLPIAALLTRLIDFFIALGLLVILMIYFQLPFTPSTWLYLPVILAIQLALTLGLGLMLAAANVFYRDVKPLLTLAIQLWFYASPVLYPVARIPAWLRPYYELNPMAGILEAYRSVLLYGQAPGPSLLPAALIAIVVFLAGYTFFKRVEFQFADIV